MRSYRPPPVSLRPPSTTYLIACISKVIFCALKVIGVYSYYISNIVDWLYAVRSTSSYVHAYIQWYLSIQHSQVIIRAHLIYPAFHCHDCTVRVGIPWYRSSTINTVGSQQYRYRTNICIRFADERCPLGEIQLLWWQSRLVTVVEVDDTFFRTQIISIRRKK